MPANKKKWFLCLLNIFQISVILALGPCLIEETFGEGHRFDLFGFKIMF